MKSSVLSEAFSDLQTTAQLVRQYQLKISV